MMATTGSLKEYKRKRNFAKTPEPRGKAKKTSDGRLFVIHKHDATRLHYDLRLELNGTLKSWAVPKGPSLDPSEKRLAVHVEDHPIDYGSFEGLIPEGEYGGGTVMLWDQGWWEPVGDPDKDYAKGRMKFRLHGERVTGGWALVKMKGQGNENGKNWLLIKEKDESARPLKEYDVTKEQTQSVKSGRSMDEIASEHDRVWTKEGEVMGEAVEEKLRKNKPSRPAKAAPAKIDPSRLKKAKKAAQPGFLQPQLATLSREVPPGENWLHEVKFDGYRILALVENGKVRLVSRNNKDWTAKFKSIAKALEAFPVKQAILDGELVVLDNKGLSSFQSLQNLMRLGEKHPLFYYVFDLPHCAGYDLTAVPLAERKEFLQEIMRAAADPIRFSEHIAGKGQYVFENACKLELEGIISKRADSTYEQRRAKSWLKCKCSRRQEFVIAGFTDPGGSRSHFGALLLAHYDGGDLIYCGRVGTGFSEQSLKAIHAALARIERKTPPVANPPTGAEARGVHWVTPSLVGEVAFSEWTDDGQLRHPSFQGLREDKSPDEIRRETPETNPPSSPSAESRNRRGAKQTEAEVAGVRLSHPDKVLFPEQGVTKLQLAQYYEAVADHILPYITGRPISLVRCPQGVGGKCFYQRHVNESLPSAVRGVTIKTDEGKKDYIVIDDRTGLLSLVQLGVLEIHPWGCREKNIEKPDWMVFDLDPAPDVDWERVIEAALHLRQVLGEFGLVPFVKNTGGKGIHVVVPLKPRAPWDEVKAFSKAVAEKMAREDPGRYIATMSKARRKGKIYVDYLRNSRAATSVAAYSSRARAGAPVSAPMAWKEIGKASGPDAFTIETLPQRLKRIRKDPWQDFFQSARSLTATMLKKAGVGSG